MMSATDPTSEAPASSPIRPVPPPAPPYAPYAAAPPVLRDPRAKSPVLAALLSLMPGLGQIYIGYYPRGFVHVLVVAGIISILSATHDPAPYLPLLGMFMVFFWLYNVIDAARLATQYNQALAGGREPDLPESAKLPGMGGSILGGVTLIAASLIVLLHTRWGVRLDWLREWWPVFPLLFGAYLLVKAAFERKG